MKLDYDVLAREYAQHRRAHPEVVRGLIAAGGLHSGSQVLDVGCGTGNYSVALENTVGCSCWGVDPSEKMLVESVRHMRHARLNRGIAEQLAYPDGFFDLAFSVDVIHHVDDVQSFFREGHRVLANRGRICTVTDSEEIIRHRQPLSAYFPDIVALELKRYPRVSLLREAMRVAGFTSLQDELVELAYMTSDIQIYRDRAFSSLHLLTDEAYEQGLCRMERDLRSGPIAVVSRYLLLWGTKNSSVSP
jgi:ubiquinone/menaquinone biosynthesis C-methylase UbiE